MAQDSGVLMSWLKQEGDQVTEGEPLMEIETDKATAEVEAAASGVLAGVTAAPGDEIPVGKVMAWILAEGESVPQAEAPSHGATSPMATQPAIETTLHTSDGPAASPVAARIAAEHNIDLKQVPSHGDRVAKADVLAYIAAATGERAAISSETRLLPASPKARRLARELQIDLTSITGSGPEGAVLAADIPDKVPESAPMIDAGENTLTLSTTWRLMAERLTQSWTNVPHFYLVRDVDARQLIAWHRRARERVVEKLTYTDLLVKLVAAALRAHPRVNASWGDNVIRLNQKINIGLAVAVEEGLVAPVLHQADEMSLGQIASRRQEVVERAQAGKLRLDDISGGTFTVSNLGMYGVDAFNAIVNPPQAAILAVGRISERVVAVQGQPAVRPMLMLSLSFDHRVVDGARGAQFLQTLAQLIEDPLSLLD
jgi:pyruvate dehydrogenase E2 component (dihydrolipoamide acetyltransferase)